jgi:catechol 2,3-dioxygenase-like lactoylglutathione lyase family enzyme
MTAHHPARALRQHAQVLLLTLITFVGTIAAPAQTASQTPPFNGVAHVAIRVRDLAAARAFYEKLGFEQAFDLSKDGVPYESFIKINDHQFLELYPATPKDPRIGFLHLCFEGVDLQAINQDYRSRGLTPNAVRKAGAGNLLFTMEGPLQPSGPQNIEYTQYMPGSFHTNDQGKHLGPNRVADKLIAVSLAMQDANAARDFYINQLQFKPIAGDTMVLHMPGDSGQEIEITFAEVIGAKARITLQTASLGKAAHLLHKQHLAPEKVGETLGLTDPDGNIIMILAR